jgi:hypothetical protein
MMVVVFVAMLAACGQGRGGDAWAPLDNGSLSIAPGTALDFSPFADQSPAGNHGRLIVNARGELAFASTPNTAVRFLSVALVPPAALRRWTDEDIDAYATAVVRQGFNMVRFHLFDEFLSGSDEGPHLRDGVATPYSLPAAAEITFDRRALDRFHRLLAGLKARGVYWNLDLMTSFIGFSNRERPHVNEAGGFNTKVQLFTNEAFRANWVAGVRLLLDTTNPHTGLPLRDDLALALCSCLNEQDILLRERDYATEFNPVWHAFLAKKYGTYAALRVAWQGRCGEAALTAEGNFSSVPPIGREALANSPAGRDMAWCCSEMECEMTRFYCRELKAIGFQGLVSNWNMRAHLGTTRARCLMPVVTMNTYHAHPVYGAVTTVDQRSALAGGGLGLKHIAMTRLLDRPFVNTESGIVFWNPFRHEQGLLFGAGAALQGWSCLTGFNGQVATTGNPIKCFDLASDPIGRASEVTEAFAFRRGDVAASTHTAAIAVTDAFIADGRGMRGIDDELSRLWAICRTGITYGTPLVAQDCDLVVSPDATSALGGSLGFTTVDNAKGTARITAITDALRQRGVLGPANRTDPFAGRYESDTGQILLDTGAGGEIRVITERLEGAVVKRDAKVTLRGLTIHRSTVPASVTLIAIDGNQPLRLSRRLLLIIATDARNTGMTFTDTAANGVSNWGDLPVRVQTGTFTVTIARDTVGVPSAYALRLDGTRADKLPIGVRQSEWQLDIDTAGIPGAGPTPFYEIVVADHPSANGPARP